MLKLSIILLGFLALLLVGILYAIMLYEISSAVIGFIYGTLLPWLRDRFTPPPRRGQLTDSPAILALGEWVLPRLTADQAAEALRRAVRSFPSTREVFRHD